MRDPSGRGAMVGGLPETELRTSCRVETGEKGGVGAAFLDLCLLVFRERSARCFCSWSDRSRG